MRGLALIAAIVLAGIPVGTRAQESPAARPLETDRPDFTEGASTVGNGRVQLEGGYTFGRDGEADEQALGEILLRYGVAERLELRLGLNSWVWTDSPGAGEDGLEDPSLGIKVSLFEAPGVPSSRPAVALLAGATAPGADDFDEGAWQPEARLAIAWDLPAGVGLGSNVGYAYARESGERFHQGVSTLALGFEVAPRLAAYLEAFGLFPAGPGGDDAAVANGGLTFLLDPNLQLDARVGGGLNSAAPDFFAGIGIARRW